MENIEPPTAVRSRVLKMWRLFFCCWLLAIISKNLHAQQPVVLPPGVAVQMMLPQPAVDVSPAQSYSATAAFDPPTVRVGEKTFYRVTVDATQNAIAWPDEIAAPPELKFGASVRGQISRVEGNRFHPLTSFVYEVTATQPGNFTVPGLVLPIGWPPVEIPPATLAVTETNLVATISARRLALEISGTNFFPGQPFRVRVLLFAAEGNQIEALRELEFNGGGLLTDKLATRQSVEMVKRDGQMRPAFVQETVATPLVPGSLNISAQAFTAGHEFGGPVAISGQVTIAGGVPNYILLTSEPLTITVRPLPDGELPGYTGTMGKFLADKTQLSTNRLRVGEPVQLKFGFHPEGDLTRFVPPSPPRSRDWQIIAGKPGENSFTLIPQTDGATMTPVIPFSAFDPATKKFYDLTIPVWPVTVIGEGLPVQLDDWNAAEKNPAPLKLSGLAMTRGKTAVSLKPLQSQGWFVVAQLLPVIFFWALWRWDERRRFLEAHPEIVRRRQAKRELRRVKIKIEAAAAAGDAEKFVQHAAAAMRVVVAPHFPAEARALVGGDVLTQLNAAERNGRDGETVRNIFAAADAQFGGTSISPSPLRAEAALLVLKTDVEAVLKKLEDKL